MEVVGCILNAAKKDFLSVSDELLEFIKERTLDKKVSSNPEYYIIILTMIVTSVMEKLQETVLM